MLQWSEKLLFIREKNHYSCKYGKNGIWGTKVGYNDPKGGLTLWISVNGCIWLIGSSRMKKECKTWKWEFKLVIYELKVKNGVVGVKPA